MLFDLLMIGVFGGFFIVPLYALGPEPLRSRRTARASSPATTSSTRCSW
ncbi:MAG: hypothetical protein MZW92_76985 [Comamonadaceae bacterium]|nr:hypothetical protein [Comamonadaceae bacterium]